MRHKKLKIFLLVIVVLIIAAAGASLYGAKKARQWFQSDQFEIYLQQELKKHANIHLAFGDRSLKIFPKPTIVVDDVEVIVDGLQKIEVPHLGFAIDFRSLLKGAPVIDSVILKNPLLTLTLPDPYKGEPDAPFPNIAELLHQYLQMAQSNVVVESFTMENGNAVVTFIDSHLPPFNLSEIHFDADMIFNRLTLDINMKGDFFADFFFKGIADFHKGSLKGVGKIDDVQIGPFFPPGLFTKESVVIESGLVSTQFSLEAEEKLTLHLRDLEINGRISDGKDTVFPHVTQSRFMLELIGQTIKLSSKEVNCLWPQGRFEADINFDLADLNKPHTIMEFKGYDVNVKEGGDFLGILDDDARHLFTNIVQSGIAESLRFYVDVDNWDDIFSYRKFELEFSVLNADIYIFPIRLQLEKVNGAGTLKDGWLVLNDAVGAWRTSSATNCDLKLDLNTNDYDFTFSSKLDFDAGGLQDLLKLINPKFKNRLLDRMESLNGRVDADLDIDYKNNETVISVISQTFNATGVYKVGKLPLNVKNGRFVYADNQKIEFVSPDVTLGHSRVQNLSYVQDLTPKGGDISTVTADRADVNLKEKLPVIIELAGENTPKFLLQWQFTSGGMVFDRFKLKGIIDDPDTWLIDADVAAKDLTAYNKNFAAEPFSSPSVTAGIKTNGDIIDFNHIDAAFFFAKDNEVRVRGDAQSHGNDIKLNLDVSAPKIDFDVLLKVVEGPGGSSANDQFGNVSGKINFAADNAVLFERTWAPVKASINITKSGGYHINLDDVALCNIALKGQVNLNKGQIDMRVEPWLTDGDMAKVLPCLSKNLTMAEGDISVQGHVTAKGDVKKLKELLNGEFQLYSAKGRISRFTLLANLLSIINVTEFYKGSLPNFNEEGFDYTELLIKGQIVNGNIVIENTTIDSSFFTAVASGNIDIAADHLSIDILVAPFKTVDRLISYIPIIGHIMGNNLVALPFRAVGPIADPSVIPLPPDAVAGSLLGILGRTVTSPISIFDNALFDLFKENGDTEKNPNKQPGAAPPNGDIDVNNPSGQNTPAIEPQPQTGSQAAPGRNGGQTRPGANDGFRSTFYGPGGGGD